MAKRPSLPTPDELRAGIKGRKAIDRWADVLMPDANVDPGLDNQQQPEDFVLDPDPTAPTTLQLTATSTSNPQRPRTLAAGYNKKTKVMTVVFRDGTWWNYYDVPEDIWEGFRQAESKGKYLISSGLNNWGSMGRADMSGFTETQRESLSNMAKRASTIQSKTDGAQEENKGQFGKQFNP